MRTDVMPSIVQMEPAVLKNLLKEVKETVATGVKSPRVQKRSFGIIDLWSIRRNLKTAQSRFGR